MAEDAPNDDKIVILLAKRFTLELPASFALRHEIVAAGGNNAQRAFSAALGVCVPKLDRMLGTSYERAGFSPLKYGGQVMDALIGKGVPVEHIMDGGGKAYALLASSFVDEKEVAEATDFTSPSGEAPTSP